MVTTVYPCASTLHAGVAALELSLTACHPADQHNPAHKPRELYFHKIHQMYCPALLQFPIRLGGPNASTIEDIAYNYRHVMSWGSPLASPNPANDNLGERFFCVGPSYNLYCVSDTQVLHPHPSTLAGALPSFLQCCFKYKAGTCSQHHLYLR
jgi:hypothetical protein